MHPKRRPRSYSHELMRQSNATPLRTSARPRANVGDAMILSGVVIIVGICFLMILPSASRAWQGSVIVVDEIRIPCRHSDAAAARSMRSRILRTTSALKVPPLYLAVSSSHCLTSRGTVTRTLLLSVAAFMIALTDRCGFDLCMANEGKPISSSATFLFAGLLSPKLDTLMIKRSARRPRSCMQDHLGDRHDDDARRVRARDRIVRENLFA
jgi:hypothetical protein